MRDIKFGSPVDVFGLGMRISTTVYPTRGATIRRKLNQIGLAASTYARRHLVIAGSFEVTFPFSSCEGETCSFGDVWPFEGRKEVKRFTLTARKDGSAYHCIWPVDGHDQIVHEHSDLTAGTPFIAGIGTVWCPLAPFVVRGERHGPGAILSCVHQPNEIIPLADGRIVGFRSIKLDSAATNVIDRRTIGIQAAS